MKDLKHYIREIPDYPKPGILFYDLTTLLQDPAGLRQATDGMNDLVSDLEIDKVVGMESRGFLFAPAMAVHREVGFVPIRKPGKLPAEVFSRSYALEYGEDRLEMHQDAVSSGERVLIVDDLLATGGTAKATAELVERAGGRVVGFAFLIELDFLGGRGRLGRPEVRSLIHYDAG